MKDGNIDRDKGKDTATGMNTGKNKAAAEKVVENKMTLRRNKKHAACKDKTDSEVKNTKSRATCKDENDSEVKDVKSRATCKDKNDSEAKSSTSRGACKDKNDLEDKSSKSRASCKIKKCKVMLKDVAAQAGIKHKNQDTGHREKKLGVATVFVTKDKELGRMYTVRDDVKIILESAMMNLDPSDVNYHRVLIDVFNQVDFRMRSEDKMEVLMAVEDELLIMADAMEFDVVWFDNEVASQFGFNATPLSTWYRIVEIFRLTCMGERLGNIDLVALKERAVSKIMKAEIETQFANNEIIIDSDNNMSDESLIELSPGYFTPSKRHDITVEPNGDISPHCASFTVTNSRVLINGVDSYTRGTLSILEKFDVMNMSDDSDIEFLGEVKVKNDKNKQQQQQTTSRNENEATNNNEEQTTSNNENKNDNNEETTNKNNKKAKKNNKGVKNRHSYRGRPWNVRREEEENLDEDGGQEASNCCPQPMRNAK